MSSVCTCEANPIARSPASAGSAFSAEIVLIGSVLPLFKSKMTSAGFRARACSRISSGDRANVSSTPACLAVARIFELKADRRQRRGPCGDHINCQHCQHCQDCQNSGDSGQLHGLVQPGVQTSKGSLRNSLAMLAILAMLPTDRGPRGSSEAKSRGPPPALRPAQRTATRSLPSPLRAE